MGSQNMDRLLSKLILQQADFPISFLIQVYKTTEGPLEPPEQWTIPGNHRHNKQKR